MKDRFDKDSAADYPPESKVRIWSQPDNAYWRSTVSPYTTNIAEAGEWELRNALALTHWRTGLPVKNGKRKPDDLFELVEPEKPRPIEDLKTLMARVPLHLGWNFVLRSEGTSRFFANITSPDFVATLTEASAGFAGKRFMAYGETPEAALAAALHEKDIAE